MKNVVYEEKYKYQLATLLKDYFDEREGGCKGNSLLAIDTMLNSGRHIYLVVDDEDIAVGFLIMYVNNQFGLSDNIAVNEYVYISPEHRSSTVTKYMCLQLLQYCTELNTPLIGMVYNDSSNIGNFKYLGGQPIATMVTVDRLKLQEKYNKYKTRR